MKHFLNIFSLFLLAVIMLTTACSDDDSPNGAINFEAKVDGTVWKGSGNSRIVGVGSIVSTNIGAGKGDRSAFSITIMSDKAGTYNLAGNASYTDANQTVYLANSGTVTISSFEGNKISGTFSFIGKPAMGGGSDIQITEGKFTDVNVMK
ncbi:DUF6252 family protein [Mongoliitalea lutea]|uniref:Uncharacterized protein n=1 Tax=Mongoliitalea lutea TaxID=849756 RepID=A0A8J3G486_9BACT|nr:DUF6252 family protein [Mongoliitalea lutea]GHB25757.1 hypothetical protein GCM10008106_03170 [Mongoliitalea lutea]